MSCAVPVLRWGLGDPGRVSSATASAAACRAAIILGGMMLCGLVLGVLGSADFAGRPWSALSWSQRWRFC